jgi:GNAT superfamily N-acetyltransferase
MSWTVRESASSDEDLAGMAAVVNEVTPEDPTSVEELRWQDANFPGTRFIAEADGRIVGMATTGRIYMYAPEFDRYWINVTVLAPYRGQGIGSALYAAVSDHARAAGKVGLQTSISEVHADGLAFLLNRGFTEFDRYRMVKLDLDGLERPQVEALPGIELTTLAARPELVEGVHAVAEIALPDIPHGDQPIIAGTLDEFRVRDVDRPGIPADAFMLAVDRSSGKVIGYASLMMVPGRTDVAWHDMTAVLPEYRGRGIAKMLKRATIAWAIDHSLTALETGNDVENAPMRAVNLGLGYKPIPDEIGFRGPLAGEGTG